MNKTQQETASQVETSAMEKKVPANVRMRRRDLLSTGSTLLNLGISNSPFGGLLKGKYYLFVGDSAAGKTILAMTCFAEASINRHFKDYRLIYDNVEDGMLMDVEGLFGTAAAKRIEPPATKKGQPIYSFTIEEFYYHMDDLIKAQKPFIYVLDSMDSLSSEFEGKKFEEHKKAYEDNKTVPGSYGDGKAKKNSENMRQILRGVRDTNSILIILSQTRDNIGGYGKTRSGGRAMKFYATTEIWVSVIEKHIKTIKGKERDIGIKTRVRIKKNRQTGKTRDVEIDIYPSYGIDDMGGCIEYLISEKYWPKNKQTIDAIGLRVKLTIPKLLEHIEDKNLENEVKAIVGKCWTEIDDLCKLKRKKKYHVGSD